MYIYLTSSLDAVVLAAFAIYAHIKVRNGRELVWSYIGLVSLSILRILDDPTDAEIFSVEKRSVGRLVVRSVFR